MYKSRIWKWGLDKKLKGDEVLAILLLKRDRDALNKPSEFRIRGQLVDFDNIKRYVKRNPSLLAKMRAGHVPNAQTSREVTCMTPQLTPEPSGGLLLPAEVEDVESILKMFRNYVDGSFGTGLWHCDFNVDCFNSQKPLVDDRCHELFERAMASFALVNRSLMKGDSIDINSVLGPCFESLKEIVSAESPEFVARIVCLLWYLDRHHKHDLLRMVLNYFASLVPIVLGHEHALARIWRLLGASTIADYHELALRLYSFLLPEMEKRAGAANFVTHLLYSDYVDCILTRSGPEEGEAVLGRYLDRAEATGRRHPWLDELSLSYAGLLAACKENLGRFDEAVEVLTNHLNTHELTEEQEASMQIELGAKYYRVGNFSAAMASFQSAARISLTCGADERLSMTALTNLESLLEEMGDLARAERINLYRRERLDRFVQRSAVVSAMDDGAYNDGLGKVAGLGPVDECPDWLWQSEMVDSRTSGWIEAAGSVAYPSKGELRLAYESMPVAWNEYSSHTSPPGVLIDAGMSMPPELGALSAHDMHPLLDQSLEMPQPGTLDTSTFVYRPC